MKYEHILWCKDEKTNADKVWGVIRLQDEVSRDHPYSKPLTYVTFWGRRGKALQTKTWEGIPWDANKLKLKKVDKGYKEVDKNGLDAVYPEFEQDLEKTAVWAMLGA